MVKVKNKNKIKHKTLHIDITMTHFRRYEFKKRRYCSQPAVAHYLHDFSDNFVEELKVSNLKC